MKIRRTVGLMCTTLVMAAGSGVHTQSGEPYTIVELGTLGGIASEAWDINASGQVVGYAWTPGVVGVAPFHAVLWQDGTTTDLAPGPGFSSARAINDAGQIVGGSFLWENGTMTNLSTLAGRSIDAVAINAWGEIVGRTTGSARDVHAIRYHHGAVTELGTLGGSSSRAWGINDTGQIVGSADLATGDAHAFLWQDGVMKDLGTLGGNESFASAVNASGHVVGIAMTADNRYQPFLWRNDVMTDLGAPDGMYAWALDVNASGQVVGFASIWEEGAGYAGENMALLWENGVMTDLHTLLPPGSGWTLDVAMAINDCGQIVGTGLVDGRHRAFVMTPPDASNRCLTPANPSPDGTELPPASQVIDATGGVWTLGDSGQTLRNGIHAGGGYGLSLLWAGGTLYTYASDNQWWQWTGSQWIVYGSTRPGGSGGTPVSPDGTELPPAGQVIDATGGVWTLGTGGQTLRDGIHAGGGYAVSLLWSGGTLYAYAADNQWWQWTGAGWTVYGSTKPGTGGGAPVLMGRVINRLTSEPIVGATVVFSPLSRAVTDSSGSYTLTGVPAPYAGAYVWATKEGYDPDVQPYRAAAQDFRLFPMTLIPAGGSTVVTVRPDDSLCSNDAFGPGWEVDYVCRLVHVEPASGVLTVGATAIGGGSPPAMDVLAMAGAHVLASRFGNPVSVNVTGGTKIIVFIAMPSGSPTQSFTLTTSMSPP